MPGVASDLAYSYPTNNRKEEAILLPADTLTWTLSPVASSTIAPADVTTSPSSRCLIAVPLMRSARRLSAASSDDEARLLGDQKLISVLGSSTLDTRSCDSRWGWRHGGYFDFRRRSRQMYARAKTIIIAASPKTIGGESVAPNGAPQIIPTVVPTTAPKTAIHCCLVPSIFMESF